MEPVLQPLVPLGSFLQTHETLFKALTEQVLTLASGRKPLQRIHSVAPELVQLGLRHAAGRALTPPV